MSNKLLAAAYKYISNGICVIATKSNKRAFLKWEHLQDRIITNDEAEIQFEDKRAEALAIITGKSSGNLEVIDLDAKYDVTGTLYDRYCQGINDNMPGLLMKLLIIRTRSGGYHFYYRCPVIEGNQKLARRHSTEEELKKDPDDKIKVLLETRGMKGYVVAPPSEGYMAVQNHHITQITPDEREILLSLARSFNEILEEPLKAHKSSTHNPKDFSLSPFDDYNKRGDIVELLQRHGWKVISDNSSRVIFRRPGKDEGTSGNFNRDKGWFSVFSTSTVFETQTAYHPAAVFCKLECNDNWSDCAKKLLAQNFGEQRVYFGDKTERKLFKKKQDGQTGAELIQFLIKEGKSEPDAEEMIAKLTNVWGEKFCTFWDVSESGKPSINRTRLINFLYTTGGFSLYYYDKGSTIFRVVKCENGFVEEVSSEHLKKFLQTYINSLPDTFDGGITSGDLMELILSGATRFFSDGILEFLARSEFNFLKDTVKEAFFPFKNGVVIVTKDSVKLKNYHDIKKVIWKSQVIDYEILIDDELSTTEFGEFVDLISGKDESRYNYACTLIGYLLHKYKDISKTHAVILAEENDDDSKGGGTGKGLFVTAISRLINTQRIDGKNFKVDKTFAFQRVDLDTKLVVIEDTRKNVDFEGFYTVVTEGITVEKKNKDELFIQYKDSPKFVFTTNYTISGTADHAKRRQLVFEFAPYFSAAMTPVMHFGHMFFENWDSDEWNRFYNFMFLCVQQYFVRGILKVEMTDKIQRKNIKLKYGEEFLFWWDGYMENGCQSFESVTELYSKFLAINNLERRDFTQTKFGRGMAEAAQAIHGSIVKWRNNQLANRVEVKFEKTKPGESA